MVGVAGAGRRWIPAEAAAAERLAMIRGALSADSQESSVQLQ